MKHVYTSKLNKSPLIPTILSSKGAIAGTKCIPLQYSLESISSFRATDASSYGRMTVYEDERPEIMSWLKLV